jgi:hypothetical protein
MFATIFYGEGNLPYFWDVTPGTPTRPDLNPLANPALERNLSRWAEVYFGNPPEKRDEAVNRLLQEIKNETSEILDAERSRRESSARSPEMKPFDTMPADMRSSEVRPSEIKSRASQDVSCPFCQHRNPSDHQFCGQCGGGLASVRSSATIRSNFAGSEPGDSARTGNAPVAEADGEVQWLRERSLGHLYEAEAPAWSGWKYVLGLVVIALGGLGYVQWNITHPAKTSSVPAASVSSTAAPASRVTPAASPSDGSPATLHRTSEAIPPSHNSSSEKPPVQLTSQRAVTTPATQTKPEEKTEAGIQSASPTSSLLAPTSPVPTPSVGHSAPPGMADGDNADLRLAQRYLAGSMGARDTSEAAKLLWKAVGKQNPTAAILLSGLYARGDGVAKNCDQARLLLLAATKHGSTQAAGQLRDLEQHGCQ